MDTKHIRISDYNYQLPNERIAKFPLTKRDSSKLLLYNHGIVSEGLFNQVPDFLPSEALMVFNNTKVIQARMHFRKDTGALIEIFLMEPALPIDYEQIFQSHGHCAWRCMIGNLKKWKEGSLNREFNINGQTIVLSVTRDDTLNIDVATGTNFWINFDWDSTTISFAEILDSIGELPIPPYLNRETKESDKISYQTVYSKIKGSVAAPTAGLHFTESLLNAIDKKGIIREEVTLHVGAGTFKPVKAKQIYGHEMHSEYIIVKRSTLLNLLKFDCKAIAVGTTSVRTLESLYYIGVKLHYNFNATEDEIHVRQWEPYENNRNGKIIDDISAQQAIKNIIDYLDTNHLETLHSSTQIMIAPGYKYKIVNMLITNFHQPQSTLLLLVSAFVDGDWRNIYDYALSHDFRFLSYGDSSLLIP